LAQLENAKLDLLDRSFVEAAKIGVEPLAVDSVVVGSSLSQIADDAVRFVRDFVAADGLQLSDRIWRNDRHARRVVQEAIEQAVIQGHSATQAAEALLARGQPVPGDLQRKIKQASAERVGGRIRDEILKNPGSPYDNALRLFRTEINRAHGEAYQAAAFEHPDVIGTRFLLSPGHPKVDICDMHASVNRFGLGPGVYPKGRSPWPAHPNTKSFVEVVFDDEVKSSDKRGKENRIDWLKRQSASTQASVLGSTKKAAALQSGVLKERQILTPWANLKVRYQKSGIDTDALHFSVPIIEGNRVKVPRATWNGFPDVSIHASESAVKQHSDYRAAKSGDRDAAKRLVSDTVSRQSIIDIDRLLENEKAILISVSAEESEGVNMIPEALAVVLARVLGRPTDKSIVQINRVGHTGASGYSRLATPAAFGGIVESGVSYLLVDDFVGQGGTLANLRGYIEENGGDVIGATVLTGKPYSAKLEVTQSTIEKLRNKHGQELENWWVEKYGYGFGQLTESEARYLERSDDADTIRNRILEAEKKR